MHLVVALRTTFDPAAAAGLDGVVQLELPTDAFLLAVMDGRLHVARGDTVADAVLSGSVRTIHDLVFDGRPLDDAIHSGDAHAVGDTALLKRFLVVFDDHRTGRSSAGPGRPPAAPGRWGAWRRG